VSIIKSLVSQFCGRAKQKTTNSPEMKILKSFTDPVEMKYCEILRKYVEIPGQRPKEEVRPFLRKICAEFDAAKIDFQLYMLDHPDGDPICNLPNDIYSVFSLQKSPSVKIRCSDARDTHGSWPALDIFINKDFIEISLDEYKFLKKSIMKYEDAEREKKSTKEKAEKQRKLEESAARVSDAIKEIEAW